MIAAIIQARLGSTRLPKKIIKKVNKNETVLEYLVNRLKKSSKIKKIIVATTKNPLDDKIESLCIKKNIFCFRGSERDVLSRYYVCAKKFKVETIIRVTSDCPLIDPKIIDKTINLFNKKKLDYCSNTSPIIKPMWPDGSDVEVFSFNALKKAYLKCHDKHFREHVTFFFWKKKKLMFKIDQLRNKFNWSNYRFTLDYKEDFYVIKFIINQLEKKKIFGYTHQIIKILKKNKKIKDKNSKYYYGIGWIK
tara:strand:+ start:68 stop:814 length:747 start_codon:yes stop_codon:yes gene_type:complete